MFTPILLVWFQLLLPQQHLPHFRLVTGIAITFGMMLKGSGSSRIIPVESSPQPPVAVPLLPTPAILAGIVQSFPVNLALLEVGVEPEVLQQLLDLVGTVPPQLPQLLPPQLPRPLTLARGVTGNGLELSGIS